MTITITCKSEEDSIKSDCAVEVITLYVYNGFSDAQCNLIQAFMYALVSCKSGEDSLKIKALEWSEHFPFNVYRDFPVGQGHMITQSVVRSC